MGTLFRFLLSKVFFLNAIVIVVLVAGGLWGTMLYLDSYTLHGQSISVPDFVGSNIDDLDDFIDGKDVQYQIIDSVYNLNEPKGIVLDQNPRAESQVKKGRKIYLTVNARSAKKIQFPNLTDLTLRQAIAKLETYKLYVGDKIYEPSQCINCVLGAELKGLKLDTNSTIEQGLKIDLIVGEGMNSDVMISIPQLMGLTYDETVSFLNEKGLNIGASPYYDCENAEDSAKAVVFRQDPVYDDKAMLNLGSTINIFLKKDEGGTLKNKRDSIMQAIQEQKDQSTE